MHWRDLFGDYWAVSTAGVVLAISALYYKLPIMSSFLYAIVVFLILETIYRMFIKKKQNKS